MHSANSTGHGGFPETEGKIVSGAVTEAKGYASVPAKEMHEFFISAVLSSLSTAFCRNTGSISLTPRHLLLPSSMLQLSGVESSGASPPSLVASFRIYLTTSGSLIINLSTTIMESLKSFADEPVSALIPTGTSILAAPLGQLASLQGISIQDGQYQDVMTAQSPETQVGRLKPDVADKFSQWKNTLSRLLQMRGVSPSILDTCFWLYIQFLRRKVQDPRPDGKRSPVTILGPVMPWPSVLCFRKPSKARHPGSGLPLLPASLENFDPLGNAQTWFERNSEREELLAKRKKDRETAVDRDTGADSDGQNQQVNGSSPATFRRTSNAGVTAAAGAMYPTPPDAVVPPGVTPSFDGTVSSPPNQPTTTAAVNPIAADAQARDAFVDGWDSSDRKAEPATTAFLEGENLFGDLGEDLFENNELTDADFNFFDAEPDGMSLSVLADMDEAPDITMALDEPPVDIPQDSTSAAVIELPGATLSPEFTKPELKHARSTLNDEHKQLGSAEKSHVNNLTTGIKRQPSPFNPDAVYKRVRASFRVPPAITTFVSDPPARRNSVFDKVNFDPSLSLVDKKYQESGQFDCELPSQKPGSTGFELDGTSPVGHRRTNSENSKQLPTNFGVLIAKITGGLENSSLQHSPVKREEFFSDADDMSLVSDEDDSSDSIDEPASPAKSTVLRKRLDDDTKSIAASMMELEQTVAESPAPTAGDLSRLSHVGTPEPAVTRFFADPEPWPLRLVCADEEFITVAQILTEQAVSGSLKLDPKTPEADARDTRRTLVNATRHSIQCLRSVLPDTLGDVTECQLRPYIEVQDVPLLGQPTRVQPRPVGQELVRPNLFQIPIPHVEFRRYESKLSVLPSAVAFWESLGLGPSPGNKDILASCAFSAWKGMKDNAGSFLDRVRSAYESLKMGNFERIPSSAGIEDGYVPYGAGQDIGASPTASSATDVALANAMTQLSQALASLDVAEKNLVVFMVYNPEDPSSAVECCAAFQQLFEKYKRAVASKKKTVANELVLQLVPLDFLASETSLAILSPSECISLCMETYDRCTVFGGNMPAPAIMLEQALPRGVEFKLTTTPSANLLHENSCIHIAYAQSVDDRWVTAAWTDNRGSKQMTASYCLGRRGKALSTALADVAHEIWETTHDLIGVWKVHWRVIITKCGPMDQSEIEYWTTLAQTENKASVSLTLVAVDTNPSLQLIPPAVKIPVTTPSALYSTPVSTPQAMSIVSPEQSGNPSTPIGSSSMTVTTPGGDTNVTEPEADTTLVDISSTTWGAVVSHRLNNSPSLTDLRPSLQSGYLIKRGGTNPEDPPLVMEVNIIHSDGNPHPRLVEILLRELLGYFGGLGTLARLRGVVDRETDIRPWHIAAAEKGVRALYRLM
jgi:mediator of RNA polymerase II transcription subunit 13